MVTTKKNFKETISQYFSERQQLAIRNAMLYGGMGNEKVKFVSGRFESKGFMTKRVSTACSGHFRGGEINRVWSEISKIIKGTDAGEVFAIGQSYLVKERALFIRPDVFEGGYNALVDWALNFRLSQVENILLFYPRELEYAEARLNQTLNFTSISHSKSLKKQIDFLKGEIDRAKNI